VLQECNSHLLNVINVEEHEGDVSQAVLVLNKESVAPIETARGVLNFGFSDLNSLFHVHSKFYLNIYSGTFFNFIGLDHIFLNTFAKFCSNLFIKST